MIPERVIVEADELETSDVQLAGDHIVLTYEGDTITASFDDKGTGRVCGGRTLCCKLLPVPVPELQKPAGVRCKHSRAGKGCAIYATRPFACRTFACRWLADRETAGMPRPDRSHYVIDMMEDHVRMVPSDGSPPTRIPVLQVWVDPAFPNSHRAPELRAYMLAMGERHGLATIVRYDNRRAITVFPPPMCEDRQWHEVTDAIVVARDHLEAGRVA
jgi:Fe-S-cluster containining protein